jgi:dUTP pyrophosphatase
MAFILNVKRLHPDAKLPHFAHPGDAGMDLFSTETVLIKRGEIKKIPTGIAIELPPGYVSLLWDKSGLASNHGLKNVGGVIDAGYRGEYIVNLVNLGSEDYQIEKGHKVAQLLIQKIEHPEIKEVNELTDSSRGTGSFGSTGK